MHNEPYLDANTMHYKRLFELNTSSNELNHLRWDSWKDS